MVYKIMSQNGARKTPKCEKRFKHYDSANWEMFQHARYLKMFKKENMVKEYTEITWSHKPFGEFPKILSRVEFQHEGYQFRYWIEIVER